MCKLSNHQLSFARSLSSIHQRGGAPSLPSPIVRNFSNSDDYGRFKSTQGKSKDNRRCNLASPHAPNLVDGYKEWPELPFSFRGGGAEKLPTLERPTKKLQRHPCARLDIEDFDASRRRTPQTRALAPTPFGVTRVDTNTRAEKRHNGFRGDYSLGEPLRSPSHAIVETAPDRTLRAVDLLRAHDFAFIRRKDGSFSYAILACRSSSSDKESDNVDAEERMTFVVDETGSTKTIRRRHWSEMVRPVSKRR